MADRPRTSLDIEMAKLADGDRAAFSSVFRALWPVLVAFCAHALGGGADADDAAQLALEKIFSRAASYDPSRSALTWAMTIAAWECATIRKRRQRARSRPEDELVPPSESPEEAFSRAELRHALEDALAQISDRDRVVVDAAFFDDTIDEAMSPAFRKQKERALDRLRALWRKLDER